VEKIEKLRGVEGQKSLPSRTTYYVRGRLPKLIKIRLKEKAEKMIDAGIIRVVFNNHEWKI